MKVTELYYLTENLRYILLSELPAISLFLSDWVTYIIFIACITIAKYMQTSIGLSETQTSSSDLSYSGDDTDTGSCSSDDTYSTDEGNAGITYSTGNSVGSKMVCALTFR